MKVLATAGALALALGVGLPAAQAATDDAKDAKPITQITCQDYLALGETVRPKFIYYAVGHGAKGDPEAVLDIEGTETIQPELDRFCEVNLDKSAYDEVMKSSMASEKTNK